MNRREFSALLPVLLAASAAEAQTGASQATASAGLPKLVSGVYPSGASTAKPSAPRISQRFLLGMLPGDIRIESHATHLAPGAPPEPLGHHKHSEIWFMREGTASLTTGGVTRTLKAGELGLCVAGDEHFICNASQTEPASYLVIVVGPPE
jgi:mannose-6-phosphate isomerase-like protein (cupin superfamily)